MFAADSNQQKPIMSQISSQISTSNPFGMKKSFTYEDCIQELKQAE
jgi:hypothetical protein